MIGTDRAGADVDARRHDPQREIGPRRADPQAVGILRAALVLRIAQVEIVGAVGGQRGREQESAWCVFKPVPLSS